MFFTKEEQKTIFKEVFPYTYYSEQKYISNVGSVVEAFKCIESQPRNKATLKDFINCIEKANARLNNNEFDMRKYCSYYCR